MEIGWGQSGVHCGITWTRDEPSGCIKKTEFLVHLHVSVSHARTLYHTVLYFNSYSIVGPLLLCDVIMVLILLQLITAVFFVLFQLSLGRCALKLSICYNTNKFLHSRCGSCKIRRSTLWLPATGVSFSLCGLDLLYCVKMVKCRSRGGSDTNHLPLWVSCNQNQTLDPPDSIEYLDSTTNT